MNSYYFYKADRVRHQANASLTKYASGFAGEHNLKFGAELERSFVKSEQGYPGEMYVNANFGVPYYAYLWDGYLKDNVNNRFSVYAQDSWTVGPRLTINPGLRIDRITGHQQASRRPGVLDHLVLPAHRLRVGRPGQQQDRRPRALRATISTGRSRATTTCSIRRSTRCTACTSTSS